MFLTTTASVAFFCEINPSRNNNDKKLTLAAIPSALADLTSGVALTVIGTLIAVQVIHLGPMFVSIVSYTMIIVGAMELTPFIIAGTILFSYLSGVGCRKCKEKIDRSRLRGYSHYVEPRNKAKNVVRSPGRPHEPPSPYGSSSYGSSYRDTSFGDDSFGDDGDGGGD